MSAFLAQFQRDLLLAVRAGVEAANPLLFFVLAVLLLGFGAAADIDALSRIGPGVIWVLALFALVLAVEGMFQRDHDDGALEQLLIHGRPLFAAVIGKLAAHWLVSGLPVVVLSPLAALFLYGATTGTRTLALSLLLGTPTLAALGAIGAALTVGTGRGGALLAILVMPLHVPVLIFGVGASDAAQTGTDPSFALLVLAALLAATLTAAPFAIAKALKISQEY